MSRPAAAAAVAVLAAAVAAVALSSRRLKTRLSPADEAWISGISKPTSFPHMEASLAPGCRILVTGGTGYAAGFIIKLALESGFRVRATVRKIGAAQDYLRRLPNAATHLEFFECELMSPQETWSAAVRGCEGVCHVASPMDFGSEKPMDELVRPLLTSTERIIRAAKEHGVKRVVVTSSSMTQACAFERWKDHVYDEWDWAEESNIDEFGYPFAKKLQEQYAFKLGLELGVSVCSIVPFSVNGPALPGSPLNTSMDGLFGLVLRGEVALKIDFSTGVVDVRDVAMAHLRALQFPAAKGRYLAWSGVLGYGEMYELLREARPSFSKNIPHHSLPSFLNFLIVIFVYFKKGRGVAQIVKAGLSKYPRFDCSRTTRELGISFTPVAETVSASIDALEEWKAI